MMSLRFRLNCIAKVALCCCNSLRQLTLHYLKSIYSLRNLMVIAELQYHDRLDISHYYAWFYCHYLNLGAEAELFIKVSA